MGSTPGPKERRVWGPQAPGNAGHRGPGGGGWGRGCSRTTGDRGLGGCVPVPRAPAADTHRCSSSSSMRCPSQTKTPARVAMRRPVAAKAGRPRSSPRHHHHHHQPPPPPPPQPRLARSAAPSPPLPPPRYQARRARRARCPVTQLHCRASRPSRPRRPAPPPACPPAAGGTSAGPGGRGPRRAVRAQRATRPTSGRRGCNMPPLPQRDAPRRSPTRHRAAPATLLAASSPPRSTHWAAEGSARPCALGDPAGRGDKEGGQGRAGR